MPEALPDRTQPPNSKQNHILPICGVQKQGPAPAAIHPGSETQESRAGSAWRLWGEVPVDGVAREEEATAQEQPVGEKAPSGSAGRWESRERGRGGAWPPGASPGSELGTRPAPRVRRGGPLAATTRARGRTGPWGPGQAVRGAEADVPAAPASLRDLARPTVPGQSGGRRGRAAPRGGAPRGAADGAGATGRPGRVRAGECAGRGGSGGRPGPAGRRVTRPAPRVRRRPRGLPPRPCGTDALAPAPPPLRSTS